jgi:large subunit ribosomal protein L9
MALLRQCQHRRFYHSEQSEGFYESCSIRGFTRKGEGWRDKGSEQGLCQEFPFAPRFSSVGNAHSRLEREKLEESIDRDKLVELAQQIEGKEIRFQARMGTGERLFGSITAADVAEKLSEVIGSVIDKKKIDIEKSLRKTGSHEVAVKLASDLNPQITVVIEEEKETGTEEETEKKAQKKTEKQVEKKAEKKAEKKTERKADKKAEKKGKVKEKEPKEEEKD